MDVPRLVLASQSPRRLGLLRAVGIEPELAVPDVDESPTEGEAPVSYALRVAASKAMAIVAAPGRSGSPPRWVLAADTVVALDGEILGKASDVEHAHAMLRRLSDRTHAVHTAVVLVEPSGRLLSDVVTTRVRFRALAGEEIRRYVATGEPMDKAGAYGIQGEGGALVAAVEGSYTGVVGLPLEETLRLLAQAGFPRVQGTHADG